MQIELNEQQAATILKMCRMAVSVGANQPDGDAIIQAYTGIRQMFEESAKRAAEGQKDKTQG